MPKKRTRKLPRRVAGKTAGQRKQRSGGQRAVEAALAALAHDIRTPLTGILALAELLGASDLGERERRWASGIKNAAEHLAQLTTIVCDAVRADAVGLTLQQDTFSPRRLAEDLGASLSARAETSGLASEITIAGDLPDTVVGDPVRLRAAVENLIDNAMKFTARGSVKLEVSSPRGTAKRVHLVFSITDTGIGLKPKEIKKLFRPFAQASESVSRQYGGTGLGLMLVKRLGRAMGGDLTVTSVPGRGSTFRLNVVVGRAPRNPKPRGNANAPEPQAGTRRSILCVEDSPYGRVVLNTILGELGHRVEFVASGEAALDALKCGTFDLVMMDVLLGGISGIEATRRIRALARPLGQIPIIGISAGRANANSGAEARAAGMNAYLAKPVSPAALAEAIGKL